MVRTAEKEQITRGGGGGGVGVQTTQEKTRIPGGLHRKRAPKVLLEVNTKVKSRLNPKTTWTVLQHIGSGGFGDVYKVRDEAGETSECAAMKTEMIQAPQRRLHLERSILKEMDDYATEHKKTRHFCRLIDSGRSTTYSWIVMTLIGPSLDQVRRFINKQFSKACVVNMALQILEALEAMHDVGFIHRDLKPGNVCTGMPPNEENVLFLLDFGISRRIFKNVKSRELRRKREFVQFYGTKKFCTRACHLEKDQGRKDDMETYVYTILDLFHSTRGLPWSANLQDVRKVVEKKKALFANPTKELDTMIPAEMAKIIVYLGTLQFHDAVDYRLIETEIRAMRKESTSDGGGGGGSSSSSETTMDWSTRLETLMEEAARNKHNSKATSDQEKGDETKEMERLQKRGGPEKQQTSSALGGGVGGGEATTQAQLSEGGYTGGASEAGAAKPVPKRTTKKSRKSVMRKAPKKSKSRASIGK